MTKIKELEVSTPQGMSGQLRRESQYVFNYGRGVDPSCEISLTMPLRAQSYAGNVLPPIFTMNRPEGWLAQELVRRMARLGPMDDMRLLAITGEHQIGRLRFTEPGKPDHTRQARIGLREILSAESSAEVFAFLVDQYIDSGISGVQPKIMAPDADRLPPPADRTTASVADLIVKSGGPQYPDLAVNEFLCMSAARHAGLQTPEFWLSNDRQLFVMKRFDITPEGSQLGFEDMAVLMGKPADPYGRYKYEGSYENIARALHLYCGAETPQSLGRLFESVALSMMVRNGDAHLKNFGVLYDHPHAMQPPRLAPVYDVVTTTAYSYADTRTGRELTDRTLALKLAKSKSYPSREELMGFGRVSCNVNRPGEVIERIAEGMTRALQEYSELLSSPMRDLIHREWDAGRMSCAPAVSRTAQSLSPIERETHAAPADDSGTKAQPAHRRRSTRRDLNR